MSGNEAWTVKEGDRVRITKRMGKENASLPEGYELEGRVGITPTSGMPFCVSRYSRNGVIVPEGFTTSPVKMISYVSEKVALVHTENSVWRVELLEQKEE